MRPFSPQNTYAKITTGIQKFFKDSGFKKAVLGVSGGIDSALTLKLLVDSIGAENVTGLIMPEYGVTKDENTSHAKRLCDFLGASRHQVPINKYLMDLLQLPWRPSNIAQINVKARIRGIILYNFANTEEALVIGTSNKSEILLGYGTKFGDLACDLMPLGDLYKTEVYALAEHLGLPKEIIEKTPSAELYKNQTDEKELGGTYEELDQILQEFEAEKTESQQNMRIETNLSPFAKEVRQRIQKNEHKSKTPFIIQAQA